MFMLVKYFMLCWLNIFMFVLGEYFYVYRD